MILFAYPPTDLIGHLRVRAGYREAELGGVEPLPSAPHAQDNGAGAGAILRDRLPIR